MVREITSTARPSTVRLTGFLAITVGAVLISLGSLMTWATIPPFGTETRGVDVWEGTLTLVMGIAILVGMIVMRVLGSTGARRAVAIGIIVLGLAATALAASDAVRANDRFTSSGQRDRMAHEIADQLGLPYDQVRAKLEEVFRERFSVKLRTGIGLVMIGGLVAALGGGLGVAWASRRADGPLDSPPDELSGALPGDG